VKLSFRVSSQHAKGRSPTFNPLRPPFSAARKTARASAFRPVGGVLAPARSHAADADTAADTPMPPPLVPPAADTDAAAAAADTADTADTCGFQ
jgi:hypothetical protein